MSSLYNALRSLINEYGFKAVYTELLANGEATKARYVEELEFITHILTAPAQTQHVIDNQQLHVGESSNITPLKEEIPTPVNELQEVTLKEEVPKEPRKIRVIKKNGRYVKISGSEEGGAKETPKESIEEAIKEAPAPQVDTHAAVSDVPQNVSQMTSKEKKKWQRAAEAARRKQMRSLGISLESLLDPSKIQGYLSDGMTYAWISREVTGQREEEVSRWCREHGLSR
jgi:hypothetical protein